jgi:ABC-type amino acid transport substrate-binding protein
MTTLSKLSMRSSQLYNCIYLLLLILISVPGFSQPFKGDSWQDIKKKGSGTVIISYVDAPGFSFKDPAGVHSGICVDVIKDFLDFTEKKYNVKITAKYQGQTKDFKTFYNNVKLSSGGVFGLGNITISASRKEEVKFTPALMPNINVIMTDKSRATLSSLNNIKSEFKGMKAYTVKETMNEKHLQDIKNRFFPELEIVHLNSVAEVLDKLVQDKNSFTMLDFIHYANALKNSIPLKRHPSGDISTEKLGMIMPMNSDWDGLFNEYFSQDGGLVNKSEYKKIIFKYLGPDVSKMLREADKSN